MATTRLFLDTRRVKAGKPAILKIAISHKNSSALISLNIKLLPERQWDSIKSKVINHNDKLILNSYISQTKNAVDSIMLLTSLLLISYDGTRGQIKGAVAKYGFYAFYPVHLLLFSYIVNV